MKRLTLVIVSVLVLAGGLGLREWLVREEIDSIQTQLRVQLTEMLKTSSSRERLNEISSSPYVFEKFVAPVFEACDRLLLPSSRMNSLVEWTRNIHREISQTTEAQKLAMKAQYDKDVQSIRESQSPGVDRMIQIAKKAEELNPDANLSEIAKSEMSALKEFGQKRDDTSLSLVKEEGLNRLQQLRKLLKKADHKKMGEYLASGKFIQEIQQPAINLILQIRQEEIRKLAWNEFKSKLNDILAKRSVQLSKAEHLKKQKQIEKLFETPMAQLFEQEDRPLIPSDEPAIQMPPSASPTPSLEELYNESDLGNPADATR